MTVTNVYQYLYSLIFLNGNHISFFPIFFLLILLPLSFPPSSYLVSYPFFIPPSIILYILIILFFFSWSSQPVTFPTTLLTSQFPILYHLMTFLLSLSSSTFQFLHNLNPPCTVITIIKLTSLFSPQSQLTIYPFFPSFPPSLPPLLSPHRPLI